MKHECLPLPSAPFSEWQIDFTHMPPCGPFKYLLVMVDKFSRWVWSTKHRPGRNGPLFLILPSLPINIIFNAVLLSFGTPFSHNMVLPSCRIR
ncbi:integrase catalytic domain-containing protein [Cetobacterium sp.]|uniref:integrase catalytic domain-containing protein n=1 Tax=Cetobacterium sp. TaxID=2071632 RepID=UPI003EE4861D